MLKIAPLLGSCYLFISTAVQAQATYTPPDLLQERIKTRVAIPVTVQAPPTDIHLSCGCGPTKPEDQPIVLVDGKQSTLKGARSLNPSTIENIEASRDEKWIKKYGDLAKNGVIFITTKKPATNIEPIQ
ncbi:hypothetical protein [Fibrella aquatica]|uniref:hypothetical protein n=1 Tax=Fibrella aquatica TaxID=3242487 RepID=UPI00352153F0